MNDIIVLCQQIMLGNLEANLRETLFGYMEIFLIAN